LLLIVCGQGLDDPPLSKLDALKFVTHLFSTWPCLCVQLIKHVAAGGRPPVPPRQELPGREGGGEAGGLDAYMALMRRCWAQAPEERPSFQDVVDILR